MSSNDYFVRITHSAEKLAKLFSSWSLKCQKLLAYEHIGERTEKVHCHLILVGCNVSSKQLKNIGEQFVPLKGNEFCSFKTAKDWENTITYMSKGSLEPVFNKDVALELIATKKALWVNLSGKQYKPTRLETIYEEIFEREQMELDYKEFKRTFQQLPNETEADYFLRWIKYHVKKHVFHEHRRIWSQQAINDYKTMVYSYYMRNSLYLPTTPGGIWKDY